MDAHSKTELNQVRRKPDRARYDKDTLYRIIDEALICHVGFVQDQQPFVIPMVHARHNDTVYLHGAKASRLVTHLQEGKPICLSVALLDGIVFARSALYHSLNYRSAVLFGRGRLVESDEEKLRALETLTEHIARGRWKDARQPSQQELDAVSVIAVQIDSASAKMRSGPPSDKEEDYLLPIWAGVLPIRQQALDPISDPSLMAAVPIPAYVADYKRES